MASNPSRALFGNIPRRAVTNCLVVSNSPRSLVDSLSPLWKRESAQKSTAGSILQRRFDLTLLEALVWESAWTLLEHKQQLLCNWKNLFSSSACDGATPKFDMLILSGGTCNE